MEIALTTQEAAEILGIKSLDYARIVLRASVTPVGSSGRGNLFDRQDVEQLAEARKKAQRA